MTGPVLITGSAGLLGYALRQEIPDAVHAARQDCDLTDLCQTREFFKSVRPSKVIHAAAEVGGVRANAAKNADFLTQNLQINSNVLTAAREAGVKRLISVLSSCAYACYPDKPSTEEDLQTGMPFEGNLGYAFSKRALDIQTKLFAKQYGCDFTTITPATLYGPNDDWSLEDGHVIAALVHRCVLAKEQGKDLEVWGSGRAVRQFVYSGDAARLLKQALNTSWGPETMIITADKGLTIRSLAGKVAQAVGFQGNINFDSSKPEGQLIKVIESRKFSGIFPGFKFTGMDEGLKQTVKWFMENRKEVAAAL